MYKVIKAFADLMDNNRTYIVGEQFPHNDCGYNVTEERLAELATAKNKQGVPLIQSVEAAPKPKKRAKKTTE